MANGEIGVNPQGARSAAQSGGPQIAVKKGSGNDIAIKRTDLNEK